MPAPLFHPSVHYLRRGLKAALAISRSNSSPFSQLARTTVVAAVVTGLYGIITYGNLTSLPGFQEVRVERGNVTSSVLTTGRVQPNKRVDIKAPLAGRAAQVLFKMGDHVEAGQTVMLMSSSERASVLDAARVKGAAEFQDWESRMPPTSVLAPVSGTIIQRNIEPGQTFTETDAVFVIADRLIVEAPVDETEIAQLAIDQSATTILDSFPDQVLASYIKNISYEARINNQVTTYYVRVAFEQTPDFVRVGMTANLKFDTASKHDALLIPNAALKSDGRDFYVFIPPAKGKTPERRMIQTGIADSRRVEVLSGLSEGDIVLIANEATKTSDRKKSPLLGGAEAL